tara:strand:- start:207 stop:569 length:363 start_codon:yes stop_codon:yes gene_type:complete
MGLEAGLKKVIGKVVGTAGLGTPVTFRRVTMGRYDVRNSKVKRSTSDTSLKGVLSSVNQREVNELIQGDDLKIMIASDALTVEPSTIDELIMSGITYQIIRVEKIIQAGVLLNYVLYLRA